MTPLVDSHCHLRFPELASQNDAVIDRARQAGLVRMVTIGTRQEEWQATREVAHRYDEVFYALGLHPEYATDNVTADDLVAASNDPKMVGIGETGFDFFYDNAPKDDQERCFREHIRASIRTGLPLIIHSRQAEEDTIRVLKEERVGHEKELTGVLHCFSSRKFLADYALDIGFYVSLSGILTFKKSQELRDIAKGLPLDRLLVETDSPFLAPQSHRGKPCEPAYVAETAQVLAEVKGLGYDAIGKQTTENFFRLFKKVRPL